MLYELWREVAARRRKEVALWEAASGRSWTFQELFVAGAAHRVPETGVIHPCGHHAGFILDLLAAWRDDRVVCPLEPGAAAPVLPPPPADCRHLKATSATTGAARLVAFTEAQLAADAEQIVATMGLRTDWPNLGVISLAHSYGFSNLVTPLLLHGVPLALCPTPLPENIRRVAAQFPAITLPGVPALWRAWHEAGAIPPNLRLAISAGAPLPVSLERAIFDSTQFKIHNFYGSTECGGIAFDASPTPREDDTLVGTALRGVAVSTGPDACLVVEGAAVAHSYWPEPDHKLAGGRFQTGDLVKFQGGRIFLRGRAGELINVAGRKIPPLAVERSLGRHPAVRECVVFGVPGEDASRGDLVVAAVVLQGEAPIAELREFLLEQLPAWQLPRDWWFVNTLTTNQLGKVSRSEWRRRYLERKNG